MDCRPLHQATHEYAPEHIWNIETLYTGVIIIVVTIL